MSDQPKHIDLAEFCDVGFLQEANRQFFHPLGLALEVTRNEDGSIRLSGVWDYRDDPEGIGFGDDIMVMPDAMDKAKAVTAEFQKHMDARMALFGSVIQPFPNDTEDEELFKKWDFAEKQVALEAALDQMSAEQRLDVLRRYCHHCGGTDGANCTCEMDE